LKPDHLKILSVILIVAALTLGGAYYWGTNWSNTTIVADTTPPVIDESSSTHGSIAYGGGKPTVLLFVDENTGIESATAEIKTKGWLGLGSTTVEKITLSFDKKMDSDTYKYKGTFTTQLEQNIEYTLIYRVTDQADHSDTWTTTLKTVNLAGTVYVNGIEVKDPYDKIYVSTLQLTIEVKITQAADSVASIYGIVHGERLTFTQGGSSVGAGSSGSQDSWLASTQSDTWVAEYLLPKDGSYTFQVQVLDIAGGDTQLASFNVELGGMYQTELVIAIFAVLAAAGLYLYLKPLETKKQPKESKRK